VDVFWTKVLGTEESPSHWHLPHDKDNDGNVVVEPVQVKNNVCRSIMKDVNAIIDAALPLGRTDGERLKTALSNYKEAMELLQLHCELTDGECERFQDLIDDFFEVWIAVFGEEGITNYIHMLGSGHIYFFLKKYCCLYLHSQQGWEALNLTIQTFILQSSQRGGKGSGGNGSKSYIFPLVRMIIRDLLLKTYEADRFFISLEDQGKAC